MPTILKSRQHFEVDGGGIKCPLSSNKIRSHFVIVSVPVKFVLDKKNHVWRTQI